MSLPHHFQLAIKYAGLLNSIASGDTSLGGYITPEKTLILKEKLSEIYDKLIVDIKSYPALNQLILLLHGNKYLEKLNELLDNYTDFIFNNNLKECFTYSIRLIEVLNELRKDAKENMPQNSATNRNKFLTLELLIKNVQDHIWKESKRVLNMHDLTEVKELPFAKDIVDGLNERFVPTWDYGPGKNPAYKKVKRPRQESASDIIKRLQKENEEEAKRIKK